MNEFENKKLVKCSTGADSTASKMATDKNIKQISIDDGLANMKCTKNNENMNDKALSEKIKENVCTENVGKVLECKAEEANLTVEEARQKQQETLCDKCKKQENRSKQNSPENDFKQKSKTTTGNSLSNTSSVFAKMDTGKSKEIRNPMEQLLKHAPRFQNSPIFKPTTQMASLTSYSHDLKFQQQKTNRLNAQGAVCMNSSYLTAPYEYGDESYSQEQLQFALEQQQYIDSYVNDNRKAPAYSFDRENSDYQVIRYSHDNTVCDPIYYDTNIFYPAERLVSYGTDTQSAASVFPVTTEYFIPQEKAQQTSNRNTQAHDFSSNAFLPQQILNSTSAEQQMTSHNAYTFSLMTPNTSSPHDMYSLAYSSIPTNADGKFLSYTVDSDVENPNNMSYANEDDENESNMWNSVVLNNQNTGLCANNKFEEAVQPNAQCSYENVYQTQSVKYNAVNASGNNKFFRPQKWLDGAGRKTYDKSLENYELPYASFSAYRNALHLAANNSGAQIVSMIDNSAAWNQTDEINSFPSNNESILESTAPATLSTQTTLARETPSISPSTTISTFDASTLNFSGTFRHSQNSQQHDNNFICSNLSPKKLSAYNYQQPQQPQQQQQQQNCLPRYQKIFLSTQQSEKCLPTKQVFGQRHPILFKSQQHATKCFSEPAARNKNCRSSNRSSYDDFRRKSRQNQPFTVNNNVQEQNFNFDCATNFHEYQIPTVSSIAKINSNPYSNSTNNHSIFNSNKAQHNDYVYCSNPITYIPNIPNANTSSHGTDSSITPQYYN